jgi:hypothetical protein
MLNPLTSAQQIEAEAMLKRFEMADPRDRWKHTGGPHPAEDIDDRPNRRPPRR